MPSLWVKDYFKHHLVEASEEYINSTNRKGSSTRTNLVKTVCERIREAAKNQQDADPLPADLDKV